MPEQFTEKQIKRLQADFEVVERIDPCSETWLNLREWVRKMSVEHRCQLAAAGVRWLSAECERQQKLLHRPC